MSSPRTGFAFLDAVLRRPGSALAFAHRGGARHPAVAGLENTRAAFAHAVGMGYTYLETDVHLTSDGVLLAFHDRVLDRVTDRTGELSRTPYAAVAGARVGGREPVPTMASLLEDFPGARFNVDLKAPGTGPAMAALLEHTACRDRVCVGSFSARRLHAFRRAAGSRVATSAAAPEVVAHRLLPGRLADALLRSPAAALQVPHRWGRFEVVDAGFVARAHRRGKHVHVWTVDDPDEMHQLLDLGVDGLMTDRTDRLRGVLIERGQWMGTGDGAAGGA